MSGALSHIRVLDLSRVLAGPFAGQTLGDLGAEVIKVERPIRGDDTRGWGPPYLQDSQGGPTSESAYFLSTNRNKKSVTIDFSVEKGQELVRSLAMQCDVLIENFKVGNLLQYKLDYDSIAAINPRLVYCSITGFGQNGPYAQRVGYDFLMQALGGLMSITGHDDVETGKGPTKAGVAVTDVMSGLYATIAILAALCSREHSGRGQHIDLGLLDVQVASLVNQATNYLMTGKVPKRLGNAHPNIVPYQDFPTTDGAVVIAVGNDEQFDRLCDVLGRPDWKLDERFSTNPARVKNREVLIKMLNQITEKHDSNHWASLLEAANIPCGPINNLAQVFQDPQVVAREMRIEMHHPLNDKLPLVASPMRFSETQVEYRHPPPLLGEHTKDVLSSLLKLDGEQIVGLKKNGII